MGKVKVFMVDDSIVARNMLKRILDDQPEIEVVGEAGSGQGCLILLDELDPDVIILEAGIGGGMNVTEIVKQILAIKPKTKIILCIDTSFDVDKIPLPTMQVQACVKKPYHKTTIIREVMACMEADE